jgi:predicted dehydrogenase
MSISTPLTRRRFLKASAAFAGWNLLPSNVWANPPSKKFYTAHIGVGGMMGKGDLKSIISHPLVEAIGLADVDKKAFEHATVKEVTGASYFSDYREMLATLGDKIDGVVISTPDHTHFPAAKLAMEMGKPLYLQKPLSHEIAEAYELVTQMGIQYHSSDAYRMAVDFLQQGIIGKVRRVYAWSNKNWGYDGPAYLGSDSVPEDLSWNLWLGSAPERPFLNGKYHNVQWRKILDFGCGTLGDMGVHILDTPCKALKLGYPTSVNVTCRPPNHFSHPTSSVIEYEFAGTEFTDGPLKLSWHDGEESLTKKAGDNPDLLLEDGKPLPEQGAMFIGENGKRLLLPHLAAPQPLPRELLKSITKPNLERTDHYHQWVNAAMGKGSCSANFDYAAPLTVVNLLGVVGNRFPGETLQWDDEKMSFKNHPEANQLVSRAYRTDY